MNQTKKWTLKALAEELGVSIATMSNAFNRPDQLSKDLRQRLLDEALRLGYTGPSVAAASLRRGKTGVVGVLLTNNLSYTFTDNVAHQFFEGVSEVFEKHNLGLMILSSRANEDQIAGMESFVDGFVIYGPPKKSVRERLALQRKPIVTVDFDMEGHPSINIDNYVSARNSALCSIKDRSEEVAILGLRLFRSEHVCRFDQDIEIKPKSITIKRLNGFLDALKQKSITISDDKIWNLPENNSKFAYKAAKEALTTFPRPTLILCMSDRIAISVINCARELGISVPSELRVTGFDDIPEASTVFPSLTTVRQRSYDKGRIAAEIIIGERSRSQVILETEIITRDSCPNFN